MRRLRAIIFISVLLLYADTIFARPPLFDLIEFIKVNNEKKVIEILKSGLNVNNELKNGATPLFAAARGGRSNMVKLLVDAGADLNYINQFHHTALTIALLAFKNETAKYLVDLGADVNIPGKLGDTPIMLLARRNDYELFKYMVEAGAEINKKNQKTRCPGSTALIYASERKGKSKFLQLLIKKGADSNIRNKCGYAAIDMAIRTGDLDMLKLLIEAGAKIDMTGPFELSYGNPPVFYMLGYSETIKFLLNNGLNPNLVNEKGESILMYAAMRGAPLDTIKALIKHGANVHYKNTNGETALSYAKTPNKKAEVQERKKHIENYLDDLLNKKGN